jgi:mannose-6-phosphate isomerase-like protein (cupin superfamily)
MSEPISPGDPDPFLYLPLADARSVLVPDGSVVHELPRVTGHPGGGMAHCSFPPGAVSRPIRHRTVDEVWFVLAGGAEFWRASGGREDVRLLRPDDSLRITAGSRFQFRTVGSEPFRALLLTVPEWPGDDEAVFVEQGRWPA